MCIVQIVSIVVYIVEYSVNLLLFVYYLHSGEICCLSVLEVLKACFECSALQ